MARKHKEDRITLAGVKIYPRIGTTPEERNVAQECAVDLTLWGNYEPAAATDSLASSIDYCQVLSIVKQIASAREYSLMETLAYEIVRNVLQGFPVNRVQAKLRKRPASLLGEIDFVEVEVEES